MITHAICNSYKQELFQGLHTLAHEYKIALFTETATLGKDTTSYAGLDYEVPSENGYTTGGVTLLGATVSLYNDTAVIDFSSNPQWMSSSITARGALIYNNSLAGKNAVAVIDFGKNYISINQDFQIELPNSGETTSIIRIL